MICKINNIFLTLEKDDNFVFNIELKIDNGFYIQATLNPNKIPIIMKQLNIKNYNEIKNKYVKIKPEKIGLCQEVEQINFNGKWLKIENDKHFGDINMSDADYWKKVCDEYETVLKIEKDKVKDLKEKLFYYEFKDNSQMERDLIEEIENSNNRLIKVVFNNGKELVITPSKVKIDNDYDDYLQLVEIGKTSNIIYKIDTSEIMGIKLYQNKK